MYVCSKLDLFGFSDLCGSVVDPDPDQMERQDPDPHPHQFADDKPKCMEHEPTCALLFKF